MNIETLPAWGDNYIYLAHTADHAFAVDPCDADVVNRALQDLGADLSHIFITHHHADHTAGVPELVARHKCTVIGPEDSRIGSVTQTVRDGDECLSIGLAMQVIAVPGHTRSHVAFYCEDESVLFSGDTLFVSGCGRLCDGNARQLWQSLTRLRALPDDTRIYCGHNYTRENLEFAAHHEPGNVTVQKALLALDKDPGAGRITVPSSIKIEKTSNPFLRCDDPLFAERVLPDAEGPVERFAMLRRLKDRW